MESSYPNKYTIVKLGVIIIISAIFLRLFVVGFFSIATKSMFPTLMSGDKVIVAKCKNFIGFPPNFPMSGITDSPLRFRYISFNRGDIIAFLLSMPERSQEVYVKRIAAIPGDTVVLDDTCITIRSDTYNSTSHFERTHTLYQRFEGTTVIPRKGDNIKIDAKTIENYRQFIESEGTQVDILNGIVFIDGNPQNFYTVKNDCYFVLGDNYNNSYDSRYFGFIPENCIVGTPFMIVWSKSSEGIQWNRIGKTVL